MTYRSECTCICHTPGANVLHCAPCCSPDPVPDISRITFERDLLMQSIADAALKCKLYNGEVDLTGPHLLMLLDDMAEVILMYEEESKSCRKVNGLLIDVNEKLVNELANKEFGKDETMYRALETIVERTSRTLIDRMYSDAMFETLDDIHAIAKKAVDDVSE